MPEPALQALDRAFKGLKIGAVKDLSKLQQKAEEDGLIERVEQFHLAVSGVAEEFVGWATQTIKFSTAFVNATGQRDSPFSRPHFTMGSELYTPTPVALHAVVMAWETTDRDETIGATVAIGVSSTDLSTKFKGAVHLSFEGYGQPLQTFDESELT